MRSVIQHAADVIVQSAASMDSLKEITDTNAMPKICQRMQRENIPWAVITAYRSHSSNSSKSEQLRRNKAGNMSLLARLHDALGDAQHPIKIVGKWPINGIPKSIDVKDAIASGSLEDEEAFLVRKPQTMNQEEFESLIINLGSIYHQEYVVVSSGGKAHYVACKPKLHGDQS